MQLWQKKNRQGVATQPSTLKKHSLNNRTIRDREQHETWTACEEIHPNKDAPWRAYYPQGQPCAFEVSSVHRSEF